MIVCVDIGNTNTVIGCYDGDALVMASRIATDRNRMSDEYAVVFSDILGLYHIPASGITGGIVSSVVPALTEPVAEAVRHACGVQPKILCRALYEDLLEIRLDNPLEIGADLVAAAVAAKHKYPLPCIVIDMGTATKITALSADGAFLGGAILPGLRISTDALVARTSTLTDISLEAPARVLSSNTADCMKSGAVYGAAAMLDGMCARMARELGAQPTVVATGGLAARVTPYCETEIIGDATLLLDGLRIIFEANRNSERN
ncbi:MAG: type III pantothenate kinase [Oscillospiraceae bacterium]|nr:type III pantothenate kinase [Oscillospiraceae bacterium]